MHIEHDTVTDGDTIAGHEHLEICDIAACQYN